MTPWVIRLLTANVVVYFLTASMPRVAELLAFVPAVAYQRPWTVVTYMFVHGSFTHLLFNMIGLFFFGPRIEDRLGERSFLFLYFLAGLGGALFFLRPICLFLISSLIVFFAWGPVKKKLKNRAKKGDHP